MEKRVKWLKHYSSAQSILIVGDGDFSFSLALATAFGSGTNLLATSLDTYELLTTKYRKAESNVMELKRLGATVLHGVDVKTMELHTDLKNRRFDRIIFNFPHAGFNGPETQLYVINLHKELVSAFFHNACHLLRPHGEIHISHKTGHPYDRWDLERLASESSLVLIEKVGFHKEDYPGYNQKRGDGTKCDKTFNLDPCCTFKFKISEEEEEEEEEELMYSGADSAGDQQGVGVPSIPIKLVEASPSLPSTINEKEKEEEKENINEKEEEGKEKKEDEDEDEGGHDSLLTQPGPPIYQMEKLDKLHI